jgi:hypothetical protein
MKYIITIALLGMFYTAQSQSNLLAESFVDHSQIQIIVEEMIDGCGPSAIYKKYRDKELVILKLENLSSSDDYDNHEHNSIAVQNKLDELGFSKLIIKATDVIKIEGCGNRTVYTYISR